jgi:hypothetical protein
MLPGWFGIESSIIEYVEAARHLLTYLAWPGSNPAARAGRHPAGALLAARHFPCSAEIHLKAVDPAMHRRGAGRALAAARATDLTADGVEFLQVKTLGPSRRDAGYDQSPTTSPLPLVFTDSGTANPLKSGTGGARIREEPSSISGGGVWRSLQAARHRQLRLRGPGQLTGQRLVGDLRFTQGQRSALDGDRREASRSARRVNFSGVPANARSSRDGHPGTIRSSHPALA